MWNYWYTCGLCRAPQHTTTHCNTLQRTATHYNTLQHTVFSTSVTLPHTATRCNTLQHTHPSNFTQSWARPWNLLLWRIWAQRTATTQRNTPQHTATHCNTLQHTQYTATYTPKKLRTVLSTSVTPSSLGAFTPNSSGACITSGACGVPTYLYMCYTYVTRITRKLLIFNTLIGACTSRGACGLPTYLYMCYTYITRYDTRTLHICNEALLRHLCMCYTYVTRRWSRARRCWDTCICVTHMLHIMIHTHCTYVTHK